MSATERLSKVFLKGLADRGHSLKADKYQLYLIQDFMVEFEMNSLSGYFYNRLPELGYIKATITAMRQFGLNTLAELLEQAYNLFQDHVDPLEVTTWNAVRSSYDPDKKLEQIDMEITNLDDYGLADSSI